MKNYVDCDVRVQLCEFLRRIYRNIWNKVCSKIMSGTHICKHRVLKPVFFCITNNCTCTVKPGCMQGITHKDITAYCMSYLRFHLFWRKFFCETSLLIVLSSCLSVSKGFYTAVTNSVAAIGNSHSGIYTITFLTSICAVSRKHGLFFSTFCFKFPQR